MSKRITVYRRERPDQILATVYPSGAVDAADPRLAALVRDALADPTTAAHVPGHAEPVWGPATALDPDDWRWAAVVQFALLRHDLIGRPYGWDFPDPGTDDDPPDRIY